MASAHEDEAPIRKVLAGDDDAAAAFLVRFREEVRSFFRQRADEWTAEDLTQDTLVRAFASLSNFDSQRSFRTWLFTIARRVEANHHRRQEKRGEQPLRDEEATTSPPAADETERDPRIAWVSRAFAALSHGERAVMAARHLRGLSIGEIASILGVGEQAARMKLFRAKKHFKENYERRARQGE